MAFYSSSTPFSSNGPPAFQTRSSAWGLPMESKFVPFSFGGVSAAPISFETTHHPSFPIPFEFSNPEHFGARRHGVFPPAFVTSDNQALPAAFHDLPPVSQSIAPSRAFGAPSADSHSPFAMRTFDSIEPKELPGQFDFCYKLERMTDIWNRVLLSVKRTEKGIALQPTLLTDHFEEARRLPETEFTHFHLLVDRDSPSRPLGAIASSSGNTQLVLKGRDIQWSNVLVPNGVIDSDRDRSRLVNAIKFLSLSGVIHVDE